MTPPSKWFLDWEGDDVIVCVSTSGSTASPEHYGTVSDIKAGVAKGKQVLKVKHLLCTYFVYSLHLKNGIMVTVYGELESTEANTCAGFAVCAEKRQVATALCKLFSLRGQTLHSSVSFVSHSCNFVHYYFVWDTVVMLPVY